MSDSLHSRECHWHFYSGGPSAPRYGGDPTKHAVKHDTETFVREVLQNANDQQLSNDVPVEVTFRLFELTDDGLNSFLDALQWEELQQRLKAVANNDRGRGIEQFLEGVTGSENPSLRILVIEDRNTTGLTGHWGDDSNYAALVRDELYSQKENETAGGSYGLGKSVLWTFSGASTVLFNSRLSQGSARGSDCRFIGRTKLPTHRLTEDGPDYQGAGWLCVPEEVDGETRPQSLWGSDARQLADELQLTRKGGPGTSAMVVGFRDPTSDRRPTLQELAGTLLSASEKYFWPAIYRGDLEVRVETDEETIEADIRRNSTVQPFVQAYADRYNERKALKSPGEVAGRNIEMSIPDRSDGTPTAEGPVRLSAKLASPTDDPTLRNHVALFRNSGMVIKYYDQRRISFGDRNFFGVLAAGTARSTGAPSTADNEIDRFLRFAEPPEHDEWESTENLREQYKRGYRTAILNLEADIREELRNLISRSEGEDRKLTTKVLDKFPIHSRTPEQRSSPTPQSFTLDGTAFFENDRWRFSGSIEPTLEDHGGWTAEVSLSGIGEDGTRYRELRVESVTADENDVTCRIEDGVGRILAPPNVDAVEFSGESQEIEVDNYLSGSVGETRLEIDAEVRVGGED